MNWSNRRQAPRVSRQVPVRGDQVEGVSLNFSETGARIALPKPVPNTFQLTVDVGTPLELRAQTVWEDALELGGCVRGVRFDPDEEQREKLRDWLDV